MTPRRRFAAVLAAGLVSLVAIACQASSHEHLASCLPRTGVVRAWHPSDGPIHPAPWAKLSSFGAMTGTHSDVVVVDHDGVVEAGGLRGGRFRAVLEPRTSASLASCIDARAYAAVPGTFPPGGQVSGKKFCAVADAADITIITSTASGTKRVTANALDMVVGAYGPRPFLNCDMGYPAALRSLASALYGLRAQVEAHGTRVA